MTSRWWTAIGMSLALALAGCGGGDMTMPEYAEAVDAVLQRGMERYEALVSTREGQVLVVGQGAHLGLDTQGAELTDFTPGDLHVALVQVAEIQDEALAALADIDPPDQLADIHELYFRRLPIAELAERAATAADWYELSDSPEMKAYREGLKGDNEVCAEFQEELDATAARGAFSDVPWLPAELNEMVDYAIGCSMLPQDPENAYRPPPAP